MQSLGQGQNPDQAQNLGQGQTMGEGHVQGHGRGQGLCLWVWLYVRLISSDDCLLTAPLAPLAD